VIPAILKRAVPFEIPAIRHRMKYSRKHLLSLLLLTGLLNAAQAERAVIRIDAAKPGPAINPNLYGIFLEEINHGVDGGLYAELIRNRAFEDARPPEGYEFKNGRWQDQHGFDSGYSRYGYTTNGAPFWSLIQQGEARGRMQLEIAGGITEQSSYCLRLEAEAVAGGRFGVANEGFFGIGLRQGEKYRLSFHARGASYGGRILVRLENAKGEPLSDEIKINGVARDWKTFEHEFTAMHTENKARLVITLSDRGTVWLDFVSLFPSQTWKNQPNGLRADLAQMIYDLHPRFVRFPGGCVVEAGSIETAYDWKLTVGPVEQRSERWGPWNYRRTQGMGLLEYFQFCEDLGAEPLYVGFAGQTCIFREREHVPMEDMSWVRDNFLDVIDYANGAADSKWGALRAKAGRANPFNLKLVEIGNENQGPEFQKRYEFIHAALKAKYPDLTYFADLSWTSRDSMRDSKFDIEDQHYYNSPRWFATRFNEYDQRNRQLPPLYLGEVAVTTGEAGNLRGNVLAALSEGVFLMGCERNADVVSMVSYAPLLGHVEGRTELTGAPPPWHAMIYFDGTRSFGTVSYYLWKLFGANRPDHFVPTDVSFPDAKPITVAGQIGLGTWADTAEFKDVRVEKNGTVLYASDFSTEAQGWQRDSGRWSVTNGVYRQGRQGQGFSYFGDESWTDYTLRLKARNTGGGEGFMIVFGRKGGDRFWWNLGGWGNTQHGIEMNQTPVGAPVRGKIERQQWYDVKIELSGSRIRCSLNGELIHDAVVPITQKFFAVSGRDAKSGDIVVKAINLGNEPVAGKLDLSGVANLAATAQAMVLQAASLSDNNSLEQPQRVMPVESVVSGVSNDFSHEFPARSLTVLRMKTK
jgi:alpha-L-arabinofuranosidase